MSIVEQAKKELKLTNFGEEDTKVMIEILEKFLGQWDSGGAVWAVAPILQKLIAGQPLSPLTGEDAEWNDVRDDYFQNNRDSSVFKEKSTGRCYDIDTPGRPTIVFPYTRNDVPSPVVLTETQQ